MLRLLVRGHDVKSVARELSISIAAANERLRTARQKLGVSSSREAARILAAEERSPGFSVDEKTGVPIAPGPRHVSMRRFGWIGVVVGVGVATGLVLMALAGGHQRDGNAPQVVSTYPASGSVIAPGPVKLSVTFDRPMRPGNFSFVQKDLSTYPDCGNDFPVQSADGRTFMLACKVEAGRSYEVWFNSPPYMNFKGLDGMPAVPFQLRFRTRSR